MVEEAALVLKSYEKTCGDVEETRRGPKGPFAVSCARRPPEACRKKEAAPRRLVRHEKRFGG